ncbi:cation diffusion facilitator family transporter [Nitratireductor sp. XY-223]|uniref:cation diffusion facilitator family transporter n=1 Tax=Nitratireductor sp. XY-223 TaxID=2561926 RepID=UPI0010AB3CAE|nr:cation diffusion facilitator family transporter [Nitratireductor sp. XY-223]
MSHDHTHRANRTRVLWALIITAGFMVTEAVGGLLAGSLALLADAGHMLTDCVSLALAWFAFRIADRKPDLQRSYGYDRFQVLAAFVNGLSLFVIAIWITIEAVGRIREPVHVLATPMLVIAVLGLIANIVSFWILQSGDRKNLNIRGAALHVLGDMLGSLAAIIAAVVIMATGWMPIDPILSIVVALLVLRAAWTIIRKSGHILLEGTPENVDPKHLVETLQREVPGVKDIHHVHIWSLTGDRPVLTMHAVLADGADGDTVLKELQAALAKNHGIAHATIQLESQRLD